MIVNNDGPLISLPKEELTEAIDWELEHMGFTPKE